MVKCAAVVGLGGLRYQKAKKNLYVAVQKGVPMVRILSAWALYEMGDESGRVFIENIAMAQDQRLSPQAMSIISLFKDQRVVDVLLNLLGIKEPWVWIPAYFSLQEMPDSILINKLDIPYPDIREGKKFIKTMLRARRRAALLAVDIKMEGTEKNLQTRYSLINEIVANGYTKELKLMNKVLRKNLSVRAIEPLIRGIEVDDREVANNFTQTLSKIAEVNHVLPFPSIGNAKQWRIWWIKNCTAKMIKDSQRKKPIVVINSPDGIDYFAAPKVMIVPGVTVVKAEKLFHKPLKVVVSYKNKFYYINPNSTLTTEFRNN